MHLYKKELETCAGKRCEETKKEDREKRERERERERE
jgi:hypothetical protein